jgi:hypothetical protein
MTGHQTSLLAWVISREGGPKIHHPPAPPNHNLLSPTEDSPSREEEKREGLRWGEGGEPEGGEAGLIAGKAARLRERIEVILTEPLSCAGIPLAFTHHVRSNTNPDNTSPTQLST